MSSKLFRAFIAVAMLLLLVVVVPSAADDYDFDTDDVNDVYRFDDLLLDLYGYRTTSTVLPLRIPLNRAWDVQWNPPGHPILSVSELQLPIGEPGAESSIFPEEDEGATHTGYYTFVTTTASEDSVDGGEISSFVRVTDEECLITIFDRVEFLVLSNEVLLFRGIPITGSRKYYETLLQGERVETAGAGPAGILDYWTTQPVTETLLTPREWLFQNFLMDDGDRSTTTTMDGDNDDEFPMCEDTEEDDEYSWILDDFDDGDQDYYYDAFDVDLLVDLVDFDPTTTATLICEENEELFQLWFLNAYFGPVSYKVTTRATEELHAECHNCEVSLEKPKHEQLCLPKDQCYTVASGARPIGNPQEFLLVQWAGEMLRMNNHILFDRLDFGEGCSKNFFCNPTDEMEFELFFQKSSGDLEDLPVDFLWSLTEAGHDATVEMLYSDGTPPPSRDTFVYERLCVPKRNSSCLEFTMGYPDTADPDMFEIVNEYSLRLDGVRYSGEKSLLGDLYEGVDGYGLGLGLTAYLGTKCTEEHVCTAAAEDLVAMEFTTKPPSEDDMFDFDNTDVTTSFAAAYYTYINFWIQDKSSTDFLFTNFDAFDTVETNTTYRSMVCIPNDECMKFYWEDDNPVADYTLYQNGNELTERTKKIDRGIFGESYYLTTKTGVCAAGSAVSVGGGKRIWLVSVVVTMLVATVLFV